MPLNPEEIFDEFTQNKLSKQIASELLILLIEKSNDEDLRLESLKTLKKINLKTSKIFIFLENILICDSNQCLRIEAFNIIKEQFRVNAIKPIIHSINTEEDICIINFIDFLSEIDQIKCREIIINRLKKIDDINLCSYLEEKDLNRLSLEQLKKEFFNYLFNKSIDALYFHRRKIPLAFDLFENE